MNYLTLFEGKILFNKRWPLLDLKDQLDLRLTKSIWVNFFDFWKGCVNLHLKNIKELAQKERGRVCVGVEKRKIERAKERGMKRESERERERERAKS